MEQEAQNMEEIMALAKAMYPGRNFGELSEEEQEAVFGSFDSERVAGQDMMAAGQDTLSKGGFTAGPLNVYYAQNPWESLAGAAAMGVGAYQQRKANKAESSARKAGADMITRRDAQDRENENTRAERAERERRDWMQAILSR